MFSSFAISKLQAPEGAFGSEINTTHTSLEYNAYFFYNTTLPNPELNIAYPIYPTAMNSIFLFGLIWNFLSFLVVPDLGWFSVWFARCRLCSIPLLIQFDLPWFHLPNMGGKRWGWLGLVPILIWFGFILSGSPVREGGMTLNCGYLHPHDWTLQLKVGKPLLNSSVAPQC